ncbi:MAG: hypothetical protein WKF61_00970 [Luteimonas sp.]
MTFNKALVNTLMMVAALTATLIASMTGCSSPSSDHANTSNMSLRKDIQLFILPSKFKKCGLTPKTPQVYIFNTRGELTSTELGFSPGMPLNIEVGQLGSGFNNVTKLENCVVGQGIDFGGWRRCDADYCVVRVLPARADVCLYCDSTQSSLDAFFAARGAKVSYRDIFLGTRSMREKVSPN